MPLCVGELAAASPNLQKRHQDWLNGPPSLLATKLERQEFRRLGADAERDAFIERFWEIRNPRPESGTNQFKEEFYRRVAWANAQYGPKSATDGWRSDMGKTYVLFGKPVQSMSFVQNAELKPIEMWFYQNPGLSELPPFFYVLFWEKDDVSGYRLYNPYVDGVDQLVRNTSTKAQAYQYLRQMNAELAHTALSLIPGEPIDTETYSGSMESLQVINAIHGYRDMPSYVRLINERRVTVENVRSRIHYDVPLAALLTFIARERGEPWLYWHVELRDPLQPKAANGRVHFDIKAQMWSRGRLVFERTDAPDFAAPQQASEELNKRPFIYEDRVPVAPGSYRLVVSAANKAAGRTYEAEKEFTVEAPAQALALSDILTVASFEPDRRERPFQFGGVKFTPMALGTAQAIRGVRLLYQVTVPNPRPASLDVEYVVGNVGSKFRKAFEETLDPGQADAYGSLTTSKTLSTEELPPGTYQVVVRVKDPAGKLAARSSSFRIVSGEEDEIRPIVISRAGMGTPQWIASSHYERALCWLAQGRETEALASLEASHQAAPTPAVDDLIRKLRGSKTVGMHQTANR